MSGKLSASLKALIGASHAKPGPLAAPTNVTSVFDALSTSAKERGLGKDVWLTVAASTIVTLNSPDTLCALYKYAGKTSQVETAAAIREVGLKCVSFNGIPRIINSLNALHSSLEPEVAEKLYAKPLRYPTPDNLGETQERGLALWKSIYQPHDEKLITKLGAAHPDLIVHIINSHYGPLLADPVKTAPDGAYKIGRVLTSVIAICCLRAQQGVALQVTSHVYGLLKSLLPGGGSEGEAPVEGQDFLSTEEGCEWVLNQVDSVIHSLTGGSSTFAQAQAPSSSKL